MGGGGSAPADTTTTSKAEPWEALQPYLKKLMADASATYDRQKQTGDFTRDFIGMNQGELQSIADLQNYYGAGGQYEQSVDQQAALLGQLARSPEEVASSQAVQDMITAQTDPMITALQEQMLPSVRAGAGAAGQYGSSRQGIAEGVAAGKTQDAIGLASKGIIGDIYSKQLANQQKAAAMMPMIQKMRDQGMRSRGQLSGMLRQEQQAKSDLDYWNRTQADYGAMQNLMGVLGPIMGQGGTQTTTQTGGGQQRPGLAQSGLGAATAGLGAYGAASGAGLAAAGPIGWGVGLLALLASQQ